MKLITWNVNSIKARKERLFALLDRHAPDVLCLQELKCLVEALPTDELKERGYHVAALGQKTYNGVALVSRTPAEHVIYGMEDGVEDPQSRLISGTFDGVKVISAYFPNGSEVGSEKHTYKLQWMARLRQHLDKHFNKEQRVVLCGDFNVAPRDLDAARPDEWRDSVLCHQSVRDALHHIHEFGFIDVVEKQHPDGKLFTWWDYRMLGFPKNNGLRIDHIYATPSLAATCTHTEVDRDERKGASPSDHAPVIAVFQ